MNFARLSLLAGSMLICAHSAFAQTPVPVRVTATPLSSPGDWVRPDDYPPLALRYGMAGITAFKLAVDTTGKASHCDIVSSSSFDLLDRVTCERLMANARFSPPRDLAGKPAEGTYSSRVRWDLSSKAKPPISERVATLLLSIDQAGNVTSCRFGLRVLAVAAAQAEKPCGREVPIPPPALNLEFRGNHQGPSAEVEIQMVDVFTPELRTRFLAPKPGYEQSALSVYHFTVTRDGKLGQCGYEEQRGSDRLVADFCGGARSENYDPPFASFDKDGVANGWHIMRALLKTGQ